MTSTPTEPDFSPWLNTVVLPSAEVETAMLISIRLRSFNTYLAAFRAALRLFDFCETEEVEKIGAAGWKYIAGRDGCMTIWHIGKLMETIRGLLQKPTCPVLVEFVDFSLTRRAVREFKASFPEFYDLRIAVAHSGEMYGDLKHAIKGPISIEGPLSEFGFLFDRSIPTLFQSLFLGRSFVSSFEGKLVSYELSKKSSDELSRIKALFSRHSLRRKTSQRERLQVAP